MKYIKILIILCVLVGVGCNSNRIEKPKKPKNLIKKQDMVNILYDMSIVTASKGVNKKLLEQNGVIPEDFVYEKHGIDSVQFVLSNEYYAYNLEEYEDIYNRVKERLTTQKTHLDSLNNIEAEERKKLREKGDSGILTINGKIESEKLTKAIEISSDLRKNLIPFSEEISLWTKYFTGLGIEPVIVDNETNSPDGNVSMSSIKLELGGGFMSSDRSAIIVPSLPLEKGNYVYSFWIKAKTPSDIGKTIRIKPEIQGGVEKIYTLTNELKRINVKNSISEKRACNFLIEIRGGITNANLVEFYLWGVQFEKSNTVTKYAPKRNELGIKFD